MVFDRYLDNFVLSIVVSSFNCGIVCGFMGVILFLDIMNVYFVLFLGVVFFK